VANKTSRKASATRRITKSPKRSASRPTKSRRAKVEDALETSADNQEVTIDRRRADRRDDETAGPQLERRQKVNRRRQIDPTTCERDYTDQEVEFMNALHDYKRKSGRMFPTCSEVLEVLRGLGYVKLSATEMGALAIDGASTASAKPMPANWDSTGEIADCNVTIATSCEAQF
jgi:hypothetical protein